MSLAFTASDTFPHSTLTAIPSDEKPTYSNLKSIHKQLNANAMSVASNRGGGTQGHLATVIPPAKYNAIAGTQPWIAPTHPGPNPVHAAGATGPAITEANRQYKAQLDEFMLYTQVTATLKKQLLAAVPETFTSILAHEDFGYGLLSVLAILNHLDATYGTVSQDDLALNLQALEKEWSPVQPIEDLWNQIKACRVYAAPHEPIPDGAAIRAALKNLATTGVFTDAIRDWRKRVADDQTWTNLQTDFNFANKERRLQLTTADAGYHQANQAATPALPAAANGNTIPLYYCWSHGLGPNSDHTSMNCNTKQPGHRAEATADNMLGGCCIIHRRMGERAVYRRPDRPTRTETTVTA